MNGRKIYIKSLFGVTSLWLQNSINSSRYTYTQFEGTRQVGWPKHLGELTTVFPVYLGSLRCFSLHVILDTLDVEIRALWGAIPSLPGLLFFFTLKIVLNEYRCMFGVVVTLQNTFGTNQMNPR